MNIRQGNLLLLAFIVAILALSATACTDEPPDTSAPERIEIDRSSDWQGALLYIADSGGPVEGWGSIRIFDNVSGFVEMTVEQTLAASPSDVFVTPDGSKMYVCSMANGTIDIFRWDGNGWRRDTRNIETPTSSLLAMDIGPDGYLYLSGGDPDSGLGAIFKLDTSTDKLDDEVITIPGLSTAHGITWTSDGTAAFVTGTGGSGSTIVTLEWPGAAVISTASLPVEAVHQPLASPDGTTIYIACGGQILTVDPSNGAITTSLQPSADPETDYYDVAFSADERYLFAPGTPPQAGSTLYIVDLADGSVVNEVTRVSVLARGIQRVE